jgi:hypothetical protein
VSVIGPDPVAKASFVLYHCKTLHLLFFCNFKAIMEDFYSEKSFLLIYFTFCKNLNILIVLQVNEYKMLRQAVFFQLSLKIKLTYEINKRRALKFT